MEHTTHCISKLNLSAYFIKPEVGESKNIRLNLALNGQ